MKIITCDNKGVMRDAKTDAIQVSTGSETVQILNGHSPLLLKLKDSKIYFNGQKIFVSEGFADVYENEVNIIGEEISDVRE